MRRLDHLEKYRVKARAIVERYGSVGDERNGVFLIPAPAPSKGFLRVVASDGGGWDHVSVSLASRCPNWREMSHVKDLFFEPEECVVQYHPPRSEYVNRAENCLHLWRPQGIEIRRPPSIFVG